MILIPWQALAISAVIAWAVYAALLMHEHWTQASNEITAAIVKLEVNDDREAS